MIRDYNLAEKSKEQLVELIDKLLIRLPEKERIEFISRWISPQAALSEVRAGDSNNFIVRVEKFCKDCLDKKYYVDPDCEEYYNNYTDDMIDYSSSKWAEAFEQLYKLAVMFSRNGEFEVSLKSFDMLFDCLQESESDEEILGTTDPSVYIEVNWDLVFEEYYRSIAGYLTDKRQSVFKAVEVWMRGGNQHSESIFYYFADINLIEEAIRYKINECSECWTMQHELYELLKSFYIKNNKVFDEIAMPESMLRYSKNFTYNVVQGYIRHQKWGTAVDIILPALKVIDNEGILEALNISLVDCYEELKQYDKGLEAATALFKKHPKEHDYYLKARRLAYKLKRLDYFVKEMTAFARTCDGYYSVEILLRILSCEGCTNDMLKFALTADGYRRHDYMKYTFKSLIYRALRGKDRDNIPAALKELIGGLEHDKISGIADMEDGFKSMESEGYLLQSAINVLKDIIQFHIAAAKRTRYARAAYYCSLVQGIYIYLNEKDEFKNYYAAIISGNTRKPALRDEMRKVLYTYDSI